MATKFIKAWIDGSVQEIEVEDMTSPEQGLSIEDRLVELEDKPIVTDGNILVGNGTTDLEEMTPEEVLSHINGASIMTMTTEEYEALTPEETNANTLYILTDEVDVLNVEVVISEDGLSISLVDTTPIKVIDAVDSGVNVCLYANISAGEVRYYSMNGRGTNSFGEYINFVYSGSTEVDTITVTRNGRNSTIGRLAIPYDSPDVMITPSTAEVGQTIVVKAVDETGKPTEWEAGNLADNLLFDRETCMLYLMSNGQVIGNGVYVETVEGGGNNAILTLDSATDWSNKTLQVNSNCIISFIWSSVEGDVSTGSGTVFVKVSGELKHSATVMQGKHSINIKNYLSIGYNLVHVSVFDVYGNSKMISFSVNVYDPDALKSTKLVERTLSGDYINDRVTTVATRAFAGLTLNRLVLPNVGMVEGESLADLNADEIELASLSGTEYWMFLKSTIGLVRLPSLTNIGYESLRANKIGRVIFDNIENVSDESYQYHNVVSIFDFHRLKTLSTLPSVGPGLENNKVILRLPEVCALQTDPGERLNTTVYVPSSLVNSYKVATNWSSIADQIFAIEDYPEICEVNENV